MTLSVITSALAHFRRFRPPEGATWEDMAREAERMALERWPGETSFRLPLPLGDCGHATATCSECAHWSQTVDAGSGDGARMCVPGGRIVTGRTRAGECFTRLVTVSSSAPRK